MYLFFFNILFVKFQGVELDRIGHWVPDVHLTLDAGGEGED
jgi:hypothetical protein